eukprot:TRINITY_DN4835_c0_g1_i1.p1 TRINITY_DN4835_c0_g1~~TRINITY_DN4835_c0_g1_i1.p1  ORF type:complete len:200 (+),score=17.32 TRINITY_DN4835_c0_g1_i1:183-782(+)
MKRIVDTPYAFVTEAKDGIVITASPSNHGWIVVYGFWLAAAVMLYIYPGSWMMNTAVAMGFLAVSFTLWPETQICIIGKEQVVQVANTAPWGPIPARNLSRHVYSCGACGVRVRSEVLRYCDTGHQVVLDLEDGKEVAVTSYCTLHPSSHHHKVAKALHDKLDIAYTPPDATMDSTPQAAGWQGWLEQLLERRFRDKKE